MTGPLRTIPEWITRRCRPGSTTCASSTGRSMVGSSCAWTSFAGQHGALAPQGRTSVLDRCVTDRERLGFTVLDRPFDHDDRECLAGLDQVLPIDLLAAEALQLLGDGVDRGVGEIDDEFSGDVKAAGTLLRKDVTGRKRLARLRGGIPWKDPPRH